MCRKVSLHMGPGLRDLADVLVVFAEYCLFEGDYELAIPIEAHSVDFALG